MRIEIRDGWPYLHPYVHVNGLGVRKHVNPGGNTCLWFEDDDDYRLWLRLRSIMTRIDAWVRDQEAGPSEPALDTHLYFPLPTVGMLELDLDALIARGHVRAKAGDSGDLRANQSGSVFVLGERGSLPAAWFWQEGIAAPPGSTEGVRRLLSRDQQGRYDRLTASIAWSRPGVAILLWDDKGTINALGLKVEHKRRGQYLLRSLEVARKDMSTMRLRAGPEATWLANRTVVLFGVGAIGSEVAVLLARSGLGAINLVDRDRLRPSNLTRHAASAQYVGLAKVKALAQTIEDAGLPTNVQQTEAMIWAASILRPLIESSHVVVDTTGNSAYTDMLSRLCEEVGRPLVAAALHRGGRVFRARVQAHASNEPIWGRSEATGFLDVPADPGPMPGLTWEVGCGAPVNNAPPISVASSAARAARLAIDVLAGRADRDVDIFEVYAGIEDARFATPGQFEVEAGR